MTLTNQVSQAQPSSSHSSLPGLSGIKVAAQRSKGLGNSLPTQVSRSYFQIVRENVFNSINTMLFLLGIALVLLGRLSDALIAVGVVLVNVLVTVGLPSIALAIWARPGGASKPIVVRSFVHFTLPAVLLLTLTALLMFLVEIILTYVGLIGTLADSNTPAQIQAGLQALATAQSALTTFSVVCGLLLILFVEPATPFFAGGSDLSKDWRPSSMALALLIVYIVILVVPPLRSFFELQLLGVLDYLAIGALAILWGLLLLLAWRMRLLERFLGMEEE